MPTTEPSTQPKPGWRGWTSTWVEQYVWAREKYGTYPDCRGRGASTVPRLPKMQAVAVLGWWLEGGQAEAEPESIWDWVDVIGQGGLEVLERSEILLMLGPAVAAVERTTGDELACVDARAFWEGLEDAAREWDRRRIQKPDSLKVWEAVSKAVEDLPANTGAAAGAVARGIGDAAAEFMRAFFGALGPMWIVVLLVVLASREGK